MKELLFRFLFRTGESIDSSAMRTDAWHHRSDSLTSLAAFIGISIALVGGKGYEQADDWAACSPPASSPSTECGCFASAWREIMDASLPEQRDRRNSRNRPPRRRRGRHRYVPRAQKRTRSMGRYPRRSARRHLGPRRPRDRPPRQGRTVGVEAQRHGRGRPYRAAGRRTRSTVERAVFVISAFQRRRQMPTPTAANRAARCPPVPARRRRARRRRTPRSGRTRCGPKTRSVYCGVLVDVDMQVFHVVQRAHRFGDRAAIAEDLQIQVAQRLRDAEEVAGVDDAVAVIGAADVAIPGERGCRASCRAPGRDRSRSR